MSHPTARLNALGALFSAAHWCCSAISCARSHLLLGVPMPQLHLCKAAPVLPRRPGLLLVPDRLLVQLLPQGTHGLLQLGVVLLQAVDLLHLLHEVFVAPYGCRKHQHHCSGQLVCRLQHHLAAVTQQRVSAQARRLPQP